MNILAVRRAAGVLLVIVPLGFTVCFTLLQQLFEYPDILRQPTADILAKFAAGGTAVVYSTHNVIEAERYADRVLVLDGGRLACDSDPAGFLRWAAANAPALLTPSARLLDGAGLGPPPTGVRAALQEGYSYGESHPTVAWQALHAQDRTLNRSLVLQSLGLLRGAIVTRRGVGYQDPAQWTYYARWLDAVGRVRS